jgi:hypothetical protein
VLLARTVCAASYSTCRPLRPRAGTPPKKLFTKACVGQTRVYDAHLRGAVLPAAAPAKQAGSTFAVVACAQTSKSWILQAYKYMSGCTKRAQQCLGSARARGMCNCVGARCRGWRITLCRHARPDAPLPMIELGLQRRV